MKHQEKGVLDNSTMVFHTPSTEALQHLFYVNYVGSFHCNSHYRINRDNNEMYEPYLLILVNRGTLSLDYLGSHYDADAGDCLFFDSRKAHTYYTTSTASFQYAHIGGNMTDYYYQRICAGSQHAFRIENTELMSSYFTRLEEEAASGIRNEHLLSAYIHMLLSLTLSSRVNPASENSRRIVRCTNYMKEHIDQPISLQTLADLVNVSPCYLSHIFRRYMSVSLRDYLLNLRISHAKLLLSTTSHSVAAVSRLCGYPNSVQFINLFSRKVGMTPLQFRKSHSSLH